MKLVYKKNFRDIFKERNKDYGNLLHKMQALEVTAHLCTQLGKIDNLKRKMLNKGSVELHSVFLQVLQKDGILLLKYNLKIRSCLFMIMPALNNNK